MIIAIDGPAGSGKSTISKILAKKLGLFYIDTGAMYRAITLKAMRNSIDLSDEKRLTELAAGSTLDLKQKDGKLQVTLDGEDVTGFIRTPELTNNIKFIARVPGVRKVMVALQQHIGRRQDSVLEGRDITTVVFPDADYKFYLDASVEERAIRRYKELQASGTKMDLEELKRDIASRDESDFKRSVGALKKAPDAIIIDTTSLSIDEVAGKILSHISSRHKAL